MSDALARALAARFGHAVAVAPEAEAAAAALAPMAGRASRRAFRDAPVSEALIETLCAVALSAPSKSDLQQRDVVVLRDPALRARVAALAPGQDWLAAAPALLVVCGNNRRQRLLHDWRGHPFANDHLDAFFNATVDAAIALSACVTAAEAVGLGCCPVSVLRNEARAVSDLLGLPDHVFPVAGLALGWPERAEAAVSMRLPLSATFHVDRYDETGLRETVDRYDRAREAAQPYARRRDDARFGADAPYGWSEDKARQYAGPERADFGAFVRAKGFRLD